MRVHLPDAQIGGHPSPPGNKMPPVFSSGRHPPTSISKKASPQGGEGTEPVFALSPPPTQPGMGVKS